MLACFDSGDRISECLMIEEQFVLNNFIYQKCACFAVRVHSHLKNLFEKAQYLFFFRDKFLGNKKSGQVPGCSQSICCAECLRIHSRISSNSFNYVKILDLRE